MQAVSPAFAVGSDHSDVGDARGVNDLGGKELVGLAGGQRQLGAGPPHDAGVDVDDLDVAGGQVDEDVLGVDVRMDEPRRVPDGLAGSEVCHQLQPARQRLRDQVVLAVLEQVRQRFEAVRGQVGANPGDALLPGRRDDVPDPVRHPPAVRRPVGGEQFQCAVQVGHDVGVPARVGAIAAELLDDDRTGWRAGPGHRAGADRAKTA